MKHKFLLLILALISIALVGCDKDPIEPELTEFNALGNWTEDGEVYTLTTNTAEKLDFTYSKGTQADAYLESAEIKEDLSGMKKLVITVKGLGAIQVELIAGSEKKLVRLNVASNAGSYEWNLINDGEFLKKVTKIRIIGAPGKESSTGNVEVSKLMFYNTNADNYIIDTDFDNIPDNVNEYDGTDENFNFNSKWERFNPDEEVYSFAVEGTVTKVTVEKPSGSPEWACIQALVKGEFSKFNYVVAKIKGTAGQPLVLKAANGVETKVTLSGEEEYVAVDISSMTDEEKNSITAIFIFGYAGKSSGSGYFDIIEAFMTEEFDTGMIKNVYNGTDETFSMINWYDSGDKVYTITNKEDETIIEYEKGGNSWASAKSLIDGNISGFGKFVIEITGEVGKKVMFKIAGGSQQIEKEIEFDGTKQTVDIIISGLPVSSLKAVNEILVFAAPGEIDVSGSFTIHSLTFMADLAEVNSDWVDGGDEVYTFEDTEDGMVVTYNKAEGNEWSSLKQDFGDEYSRFNTITLVIRGTDGKSITLKPNNQGSPLEKTFVFEEGKDITYTVTSDKITTYVIFGEGGTAPAEGSFTIVSTILSYVRPEGPKADADVNSDWLDNDGDVYTFEETEDGLIVSYDKKAGHEWSFIKKEFSDDLAGYNTITLVLRGTAGKVFLIKLNDSKEFDVTFKENEDLIFTASADQISSILIFADKGLTPASDSFTIVSAILSYVETE